MKKAANDTTDQRLIAQFKAGSAEAMEKIIEKYENSIFTFGLKMCGHRQDAEDIVQETFLNAFRYLEGFRQETKLRNWLFKIAARVCQKKRRKRKYEPDQELSLEALGQLNGSEGTFDIPDWSQLPSDEVLTAELKQVIQDAIVSLPPKYRFVFNLRDIQGFNTEETAEIMGISTQSVKTRLHRARLFLRKKIASRYREGKTR